VLCHVCTNRAHAGHDGVATEQAERLSESTAPSRQRPAPTEVPKRLFLENEKTRGLVILGGFAAVTITLWLIFPVEKYIAKFFASSPTEMPEDTPQSLDIVMLIVGFLLGTLNFLVRIYVGLAMCDKLLNEEFHLNLIQVGGIAAVFCGISFAAIHPSGFIYVIIFRVWLIWHVYDLEMEKFLPFFFVYSVGGCSSVADAQRSRAVRVFTHRKNILVRHP